MAPARCSQLWSARRYLLGILLCVCTAAAQTQMPQSARLLEAEKTLYYPSNDINSLLPVFIEEADAGSAAAKRDLGLVYLRRHNGSEDPDPELALQWFEAAAIAGDTRAPSYIGDFYKQPTSLDQMTAQFWYQKGHSLQDARATLALASMELEALHLTTAGSLLNEALGQRKATDPADVLDHLHTTLVAIGDAYHAKHNDLAANSWYDKAIQLNYLPAVTAKVDLYIGPDARPENLPRAIALTDSFAHAIKDNNRFDAWNGEKVIADLYNKIGARYEQRGIAALPKAETIYLKAAAFGDASGTVKLTRRLIEGDHIPQDLAGAFGLAQQISEVKSLSAQDVRQDMSLFEELAPKLKASPKPQLASLAPKAMALMEALESEIPPTMNAVADMMPAPPVPAMVERYPNIAAPDTVTTQQDFAVNVSLNAIQFDNSTQILSGQQDNGKLQITLPDSMKQMPIQVDLIAPGMTFASGETNSGTLLLTADQANSTPAVFHLRAGSAPASGMLMATLSYHQNFIAQLARPISVVAASAPQPPPSSGIAPHIMFNDMAPAPVAPVQPAPGNTTADAGTRSADAAVPQGKPTPKPPSPPNVGMNAPLPPPRPAPIVIDPTEKATDLTITETVNGDTVYYAFASPGLAGTVFDQTVGVSALKARVDQLFKQLESQSNILSQGGGATCKAARAKGAGGINDPSCSDSVQAHALLQGIGTELYAKMVPQSFRDVYTLLTRNHIRLHSITVITNSPTLPWELMLPTPGTDGFLGLTSAIVRENMSAPQLARPANVTFNSISVLLPSYDGALKLPSAATEAQTIKAIFPVAKTIPGDADSVGKLVRSVPQGIVHYTGHGQRIAPAAGTSGSPQEAILLEDQSMTPDTFAAFRADGAPASPFYFFNACDLGRADPQESYIDGWAPTLMQSGASGYLGALFEVGDASATSFSAHFYTNLKAALTLRTSWSMADVVTQARQQTYAEANDPTALAYVLYAKPFLKLTPADDQ